MSDKDETGGRIRGQRRRRRSPERQVDAEDEDTFTVDRYKRPLVRPLENYTPDWSSPEMVEHLNEVKRLEKEVRENNLRVWGGLPRAQVRRALDRVRRELDEEELDEDELDE